MGRSWIGQETLGKLWGREWGRLVGGESSMSIFWGLVSAGLKVLAEC